MSEQSNSTRGGFIPEWTLGWRLQRSLAYAELTTEQMAAELGVARSTISRWTNDHGAAPRSAFVKQWALRCGVPYGWLATGIEANPTSPDAPSGLGESPTKWLSATAKVLPIRPEIVLAPTTQKRAVA